MIEQMKTAVLNGGGSATIIHAIPSSGRWRLEGVYVDYVDDADSCIVRIEVLTPQKTGYWAANNVLLYDENNNFFFACGLEVLPGDEVITAFTTGTAGSRVRSAIHLERIP